MVDISSRRKRPHNTIATQLGVAILSGSLSPGHTLDSEDDASLRLNVSRSAYREALRTLAAKGLVQSRPKSGTRVLTPERWNLLDLDVLTWLFESEPDEKTLRDLFGLRQIVEPAAAGLAALSWTDETFEPLRVAMDGMISSENSSEEWRRADRDFHDTLIRLADNAFLTTLSSAVSTAVRLTTIYKLRNPVVPRNSTLDHLRIYESVHARDEAGAISSMRALIDTALEETLSERQRPKGVASNSHRKAKARSA